MNLVIEKGLFFWQMPAPAATVGGQWRKGGQQSRPFADFDNDG